MKDIKPPKIVVTGIGVTSAIGQGKEAFFDNLISGKHTFDVLKREGRQKETSFLGAEMEELVFPEKFSKKVIRNASLSGQTALVTLNEAWCEAKLEEVDPSRLGLVVGGSNFQQRELLKAYNAFNERLHYTKPNYALSFMDTDVCGLCTEQFGIMGRAFTVGGASASGQLALIHAIEAVQSKQLDVCIAVGVLMDLSYLELQAFRIAGAMGSDTFGDQPSFASRPFDKRHNGFIYGECCGVVVVESSEHALRRNITPYAEFSGWSIAMDGNRNPNSSYDGEVRVIMDALKSANINASEVHYVNPHGTGSISGDETELKALKACGLADAYINTTKSIIGHGLTAAGMVEVIATLLQMKEGKLHPSRNLEDPIDDAFNWVKEKSVPCNFNHALNLSYGFGGINTAVCLKKV